MKFGTSGLRGLATDLLGSASYRYTAAFAHNLLYDSGWPWFSTGQIKNHQ